MGFLETARAKTAWQLKLHAGVTRYLWRTFYSVPLLPLLPFRQFDWQFGNIVCLPNHVLRTNPIPYSE